MARVYLPQFESASLNEMVNDRLDRLRELNETLARAAPVVIRKVSSTMKEIAALTAELELLPERARMFPSPLDGTIHSRVNPSADEIAGLEIEVREMHAAFERVRSRLAPMARMLLAEGTADDLRVAADALSRYEQKPTAKNRAALRRVASMRPTRENWRVTLVQQVERTQPRLASASEFDWAYYEIAAGFDKPCDNDTFATKRRDRWRDVLRRARKSGEARA